MTREHKLALILGFALVLIVGVLISDHMSGVRQTAIQTIALEDGAQPPLVGPGGLSLPPREQTRPAPVDTLAAAPETSPIEPPAAGVRDEPRSPEPIYLTMSPDAGRTELPAPTGNGARAAFGQLVDNLGDMFVPTGETIRTAAQPYNGQASQTRTPQQPAAAAPTHPAPKVHIVKEGESLWSIAQDHYNDGKLHERLAAYNASRLPDPSTMPVGLNLLIPDRRELEGTPAGRLAQAGRTATAAPASAAQTQPRAAAPGRTYTVKRGDTLGEISIAELGTSRRWREIYELNRDRVKNPDHVPAGTVLRIPAR